MTVCTEKFPLQSTKAANVATLALLSASALCLGLAGCSPPDPAAQVAAMNGSNIQRVANLYMAYQLRHGMQGPKDEQSFRGFVTDEMPDRKLEMMGINKSQIDELLKSEHDGKDFEIVYGINGGMGTQAAVVFSSPSDDGVREVAFTYGSVEEVDNARYEELKQNPIVQSKKSATSETAEEDRE